MVATETQREGISGGAKSQPVMAHLRFKILVKSNWIFDDFCALILYISILIWCKWGEIWPWWTSSQLYFLSPSAFPAVTKKGPKEVGDMAIDFYRSIWSTLCHIKLKSYKTP